MLRLAKKHISSFRQNGFANVCHSSTNVTADFPLKDIRVLDLTRIVAGPYCTMILSDLGAEVIKVEKPGTGDESRLWGPPFVQNTTDSVYFMACNRNKKSICVDLKTGRELIYELAAKCDVLVENYIPGKLDKMGLGYEHIKAIAPHMIYCSITGYGPVGPYKHRPGYDVIASSMAGLVHITGTKDGPPAKVGVAMTDIATGLYAHGAILSALLHKQKTGRGQKVDVNLMSTQIASLINIASNYLNAGLEADRMGTAHGSIVPYEAFQTKDGYLTVGAGSDEQFKSLCKYLSIEELSKDQKFLNNSDRVKNRTELIKILSDVFKTKTSIEWMDQFGEAPFPVGPVNSISQVFQDNHVKSINIVKSLPHPSGGSVRVVGPPVLYSDIRNEACTAPPTLGQHTDQILGRILGYSEEKILALRASNIIQ